MKDSILISPSTVIGIDDYTFSDLSERFLCV